MAGKYCCFVKPEKGYEEHELTDVSPAGYQYGFPIFNPPNQIGEYKVIKAKGRGFYGATYVVKGRYNRMKIFKVIPKSIYKLFGKNFEAECNKHAEVAEGSNHIVQIEDDFNAIIDFPNVVKIDCHVAILSYVEGDELNIYLSKEKIIPAI